MYERVISGLRSTAVAKVIVQIVSWAGTILVLRRLDSEALGVYALAAAVFSYASLIYEGGLLEALVQRAPVSSTERRAVYTLLTACALVLGAGMSALAMPIAAWTSAPDSAPIMWALALALLVIALGILPHAQLLREMRFGRLAVIASGQAVTATGVTLALAYNDAGAWSLALGLIAGLAVRTLLLNVAAPNVLWPGGSMRAALGYMRFGGVLIIDGFLWRWYSSLDTFLLGRWAGTAALGQYSFSQQVANMPLEKISTVVNDVSLPAYAEFVNHPRAAARFMLETIRTHAAVGLPMFWGLAAVGHLVVPVVFGDRWHDAIIPLVAFAMVAPLRLMGSVETPAMTGIGRPSVLIKTKLIIVPCMTLALVIGCRLGGIQGAALAWLVVFPLCYAIAFRLVLRAIGLTYGALWRAIRGTVLAAALMAGTVRLIAVPLQSVGITPLFELIALIVIGVVTYLGVLWGVDRAGYRLTFERAQRLLALRGAG